MSASSPSPRDFGSSSLSSTLVKHELVAIDARRVMSVLNWLMPMGEAALAGPKRQVLSDTDYEFYLRDAIDLAHAELSVMVGDPFYACSAGNEALDRLTCALANVVGEPQHLNCDAEQLWALALRVVK